MQSNVIRYLGLMRKLIKVYNLEPAGSHGVWGLDDHFFLPFIFGSAQLSPPLSPSGSIPLQGSGRGSPKTDDVAKKTVVDDWRERNMYFSAVGFVFDVKRGPFWEHSRMLYDISGVPGGWAKINKVCNPAHGFCGTEPLRE
jgi:serine/threonine-protein phosphatase 2A activator